MTTTNTHKGQALTPVIGGFYNWIGQPERLIYMGAKRYSGDPRHWHQFAKVETPHMCWSEVLTSDLASFEETKGTTMTTTPTSGAADLRATFSEMLVDLPNTEPYTLFQAGFDAALAAGQATAAQQPDSENLRKALQFYADSEHFIKSDGDAWDTVSDEPQNYWCDEAGTATVEDGHIARLALSGHPVRFEDDAAQPAAQQVVAYAVLPAKYYLAGGEVPTWDEKQMHAFADATCALRAAHGQAPADLSPTAGMNIAQRILHVGGRNNDAGYVEFGSIQAVEALVRQVLRDLPAPATADSVPTVEYLRSQITGMSVSVDVSTGDADAGHRYFGTVTEVMECQGDKHGVTLLVQDAEPNFKADSVLEDAARWEFRWLNPANNLHVAPSDLGWKTVNSKGMRSEKEVLEDLQAYRYQGKPVYEVRPLLATRALEKPEIRCPVRLANGGDCPRHNLQCGWPDCNKESK